MQTLAIDLVGPFVTTPRNNKMVLVIADHFTRWRDAIAIPDGTAESVATALESLPFNYFGLPETVHMERGAQFESELMKELYSIWGVNKTRTAQHTILKETVK